MHEKRTWSKNKVCVLDHGRWWMSKERKNDPTVHVQRQEIREAKLTRLFRHCVRKEANRILILRNWSTDILGSAILWLSCQDNSTTER